MKRFIILMAVAGGLALQGCGEQTGDTGDRQPAQEPGTQQPTTEPAQAPADAGATADEPGSSEAPWVETTLIDREGQEIGTLSLEPVEQGVRLAMHVEGLSPGPHAVHFHQQGRCDPPDFQSAGGHFNPAGARHGMPDNDEDPSDPDHHAGDMLNQDVNDNEILDTVMVNSSVTLSRGQENSLLEGDGTALIIHADPDDYESQPSGDAGDRVACAPITSEQTVGTR